MSFIESKPQSERSNKIIGRYRDIPLRIYNRVYIRVTVDEYIRFIDAHVDFGLSARAAIVKHDLLCKDIQNVSPTSSEYIGCVYRGKKIKRFNRIKVSVSITEYKSFIDAKIDYLLSARQAIIKKKFLCQCNGLVPISAN